MRERESEIMMMIPTLQKNIIENEEVVEEKELREKERKGK